MTNEVKNSVSWSVVVLLYSSIPMTPQVVNSSTPRYLPSNRAKGLSLVGNYPNNSFSQFLGVLENPHNFKIFNQIPAVNWQSKNKWFLSSTSARQNTQDIELMRPHSRSLSCVLNLFCTASHTMKACLLMA